ncbi:ABC transporter substrate-binding protein [Modestobacter sp. I12A-02628]|uniref:Iron-siderophore ABC transporter substrate-binding protein n=1 Tax=Goekera deserti TaxID=2497753 RepID=A0A7K3WD55_9ACTN|nr:iron-siderophore ABC transporter substrate-binding protein [Goekera deserti]MPQ98293.1 ABC transporter substrate-binding protein [Goekera deserti]NDI48120.1 ABC transporter substrate-binding protein [Goekera deserti]NEL53869.1 iron-siderophore ABC transporter substrate-binding protein [Goekera deserti]
MRSTRPVRLVAPLAVAALLVTGCGSSESDTDSSAAGGSSSGAFPVTIEHTFGETVIDEQPVDVVTWGFGSTDAALALGVVPVAIPTQTYGGDAEGVLPWIGEKLDEMGAERPTMLPDGDEVPFEAIAAAQPDVILANYSGITEEEYRTLSEIAPTVAYPGEAWATPWRDVVTTVGQALGKAEEAEQLVADTDKVISDAAAEHPELQGKTVAAVWDTAGTFYVYKPADARVEFLTDLGLTVAPSVTALDSGESTFYTTISYEQVPELTSDILLSYASTPEEAATFDAQPYTQLMPQVQSGHHATMIGTEAIAAVSPPTVLSLTYSLDDYLQVLSDAA